MNDLVIHINRSKPLWSIELVGDRFYMQQKSAKAAPKKLKADWIKDIHAALGDEVPGLDKCTIATLTHLLKAIEAKNA